MRFRNTIDGFQTIKMTIYSLARDNCDDAFPLLFSSPHKSQVFLFVFCLCWVVARSFECVSQLGVYVHKLCVCVCSVCEFDLYLCERRFHVCLCVCSYTYTWVGGSNENDDDDRDDDWINHSNSTNQILSIWIYSKLGPARRNSHLDFSKNSYEF